ncbi:hypothetical protein YC2023_115849 [Brassica napus]
MDSAVTMHLQKGAADEEKNVAFVFQPGKLIKLLRKHHLRDATRYMLSNSCLSTSFVKSVLRENVCTRTLNMMLFSASYILFQLQLVCWQKNAIDEFLMSKSVPLRSGLQE